MSVGHQEDDPADPGIPGFPHDPALHGLDIAKSGLGIETHDRCTPEDAHVPRPRVTTLDVDFRATFERRGNVQTETVKKAELALIPKRLAAGVELE